MDSSRVCENCRRPILRSSTDGRLCDRCIAELGIEDDVARDVGLNDGPDVEGTEPTKGSP